MNQEKVMTQMSNSAGDYLAPTIEVKELKCRRVICQSPTGGTENSSEGSTDAWY